MFDTDCVNIRTVTSKASITAESGFTVSDLLALNELHARRLWSRSQMVTQEFAQYLAVWGTDAEIGAPPAIVLAKFTKTGTYAVMIGSMIVANGSVLGAVLPVFLSGVNAGAVIGG